LSVFGTLLPSHAQNPFGIPRPPNAGAGQASLDKVEKRAFQARKLMGQSSAYEQWKVYFLKSSEKASGSAQFVPHATYGLKNILHILNEVAGGGDEDLARALTSLRSILEHSKSKHSRRDTVMKSAGSGIAKLQDRYLKSLLAADKPTLTGPERARLELIMGFAEEAGVVSAESKNLAAGLVARSDFVLAMGRKQFGEAEAAVDALSSLQGKPGTTGIDPGPAKLELADALLVAATEPLAHDENRSLAAFEDFSSYADRQGEPPPARCLNAALAFAEFQTEYGRSPAAFLDLSEDWFPSTFPGKSSAEVYGLIAEQIADRHPDSPISLHVQARCAAALPEASAGERIALQVRLADSALSRLSATASVLNPERPKVPPDYALTHRILLEQVELLIPAIQSLDADTLQSSGLVAFLLRFSDTNTCTDPKGLLSELRPLASIEGLSEALRYQLAIHSAAPLARDPSRAQETWDLLSPWGGRDLSSIPDSADSASALFAQLGSSALFLGRPAEACEYFTKALASSPDDDAGLPWELHAQLAAAASAVGDTAGQLEALELACTELAAARTQDIGAQHNTLRRLASLNLALGKTAEFGSLMQKIDALSQASSGSPSADQPWLSAEVYPGRASREDRAFPGTGSLPAMVPSSWIPAPSLTTVGLPSSRSVALTKVFFEPTP
jgi:tetratricopeptide (TPR) repeat protein